MKEPAIKPQSVTDQVADYIAEAIVSGDLAGDTRIQEQPWAERLGVSRGSVREALLLLERRQMVVIEARKGARVTTLDAAWATEICEAWLLIMGDLLRRLPERLGEDGQQRLREHLSAMREARARGDLADFYGATLRLMHSAALMAQHRVLNRLLSELMPAVRRCFRYALDHVPGEPASALAFASELLDAVEEGSGERIAEILERFGSTEIDRLAESLRKS